MMWIQQRLQQGLELLNLGRISGALACANEVLEADPNVPNAHFLVALIAQRAGEHEQALESFARVTQLDPRLAQAWAHLAEEQARAGRYDDAARSIARAIREEDGNPMLHQLIGLVLSALNDHVAALAWHERAIAAAPNNGGFLLNLATCQMYVGRLEDAESSLRRLLDLQPAQANAHWLLAGLKKADDTRHIAEVDELIGSGRFRGHGLAMLHYARGKEFEDLGDWENAFEAFTAGAAARRSSIDYDEEAEVALFAALEEACDSDWVDSADGDDSSGPVFILGQPRTGTTLVERILTAHSAVHSAGELRQFAGCMARLAGFPYRSELTADIVRAARAISPDELGASYMESVRHFRGSTNYFVDKRPINFLLVPFILASLPNARIVHLRRGAMDTCFSVFKQLFTSAYPHSYDLAEMARHFVRYHRLMELWRERFGGRFIELSYEGVTADFEATARDLVSRVGIGWEDACGAFDKQATPVATASSVQVRKGVHTKSIGRWHRYREELQPVASILGEAGVPLEA